MLLGHGESLGGVVDLIAVSLHHSLLYVLALVLCPLFLCCLRLRPDSPVHFFVLESCFSACVFLLFQLPSLVAQTQNLVCDPGLNLFPLFSKDLFSY